MSVRVRLTLWYAAVLAISLIGFSALTYTTLERVGDADIDSFLAEKAEDVARGLRLRGELSFLPRRATLPRSSALSAPIFTVQLLDPSGRIVDRSENLGDEALPVSETSLQAGREGHPVIESAFLSGQEVRLYTTPVHLNDSLVGFIQVGRPLSTYNRTLGWLRSILLIVAAAMVIVASGVGYLLSRATLSPINKVTQAARAIGQSRRIDRRLQPYPHRDEIGDLISTFNEMLERLEAAFAAQRRFVSDASHELRTPLTTIRGNVEVLRKGVLDAAEQAEALRDIADEAERMSRLIAGLLALARADAGRHLDRQLVNLENVVQDVYRQAQMLAGELPVYLDVVEPAEVLADADHLRQLLLILVENAIKYNRPGGEVRLALTREGDWIKLTVADTGVGIPADALPHVFERFYRAPSARKEDGTGLGLAIAQWIAEEHEGRIDVESVLGRGSSFSFWIPSLAQRKAAPARAIA